MATNIDATLTVQDAVNADHSPHIFTMSNGDLLTIYYDGTNLVWRSKSGGSWVAATTITLDTGVTPPQVSYLTRNGDTIFAVVSKDPIDASHNGDFFQFTYNTATHTLATTNKQLDAADGAEKAAGIGYTSGGSANNQVLALHGNAAGNFATIQQLNVNPTIFGTDQVPTMMDYRSSARTGLVTDGTTVNYLIYAIAATGTAFKVERFATSSATDNVESPPAPAANLAGVTAVWDGTNYVFVANENNAKLRFLTRTGTNTYGAWTDILSDASLTGQPAVCVKSNGDLAVFYRTNKNQANGEIWCVQRTGGTWGSPSLLAGGASTGWSNPSCAASDLNDTGVARVVYVTGTASTWTLVEDSLTFGGGATTFTRTVPASAALLATATRAVPSSAALLATNTRQAPASAALQATNTRTVSTSATLLQTLSRAVPASAALVATQSRTVPGSAALRSTQTRTVTASGALLATNTRQIVVIAALSGGASVTRQIPASAALLATVIRQVPASAALLHTNSRTVNAAAALSLTHTRAVPSSAALVATLTRQTLASVALLATVTRIVPSSAALRGTFTRTIQASVVLLDTSLIVPGDVALTDARTASATLADALVDRASLADARIAAVALSDT